MSGKLKNKIIDLQERFMAEQGPSDRDGQINDILPSANIQTPSILPMSSPVNRRPRQLDMGTPTRSRRQLDLPVHQIPPKPHDIEVETKIREIMKMNGMLTINGKKYLTDMKDLIHMGELGNGTCGHVVKMLHKPSNTKIAVKQMRRSGNTDENKRIIMDLDVVLKSHDCPYIVQCLGCFITESDVWICMELMATCLDKLLKKSVQPMPEAFLGKVTVATVKALSYLKDKHGVIHRDVKPSNILLDSYGGVKLCDFGISGRLVDSKAKTRSAGCAAYMAPERIDPPDPTKPAYDIRADVWSLGITLVELATGVFPYRDCKTDFEVLSRVVEEDPPVLPSDAKFSKEFRSFVASCLTKNYKQRPKYTKLMEHSFIKLYENDYPEENILMTDSYQWFNSVMQDVNPRLMNNGQDIQPDVKSILPFKKNDVSALKIESISPKKLEETILSLKKIETISLPQKNTGHISLKQTVHQRSHSETPNFVNKESQNSSPLFNQRVTNIDNGGGTNAYPYSPYTFKRKEFITRPFSPTTNKDTVSDHETRPTYTSYRQYIDQNRCATNGQTSYKNDSPNNLAHSRPYSPYLGRYDERDKSTDRWQNESRSLSPFKRDYSPWRRENVDPPGVIQPAIETSKYSPFVQHRKFSSSTQNHPQSHDIYGSPMISRKRFPSEPPPPLPPSSTSHGSTSPQLLISRFAHQQKLDATTTTTTANSTVQTNSKESAKKRFASYVRLRLGGDRAPSPEPPPRLSRGESPLALRRNVPEQTASPSFPRRYVSPSPPQPPPRRLSESSSVPGSPQYARSRLHYTLEQQGRPPPP
ncbi:hypothetical protein HCN44_005530 [Aphidius gifuensis]|uniref:mitogen-activated protein kinase kinase n=1 Tax=Aphidius gifuensis TaxID=684658 RepID=A0A834Y4Z8_APHGI|nr:dual specificity mitogen-activated protein kinase kinase hemipterous-like isoform X2 [Aphidius gifuensis]KAF7997253.1 hypothetical protein HCN44_005530 [Aphidius gifuensis]